MKKVMGDKNTSVLERKASKSHTVTVRLDDGLKVEIDEFLNRHADVNFSGLVRTALREFLKRCGSEG